MTWLIGLLVFRVIISDASSSDEQQELTNPTAHAGVDGMILGREEDYLDMVSEEPLPMAHPRVPRLAPPMPEASSPVLSEASSAYSQIADSEYDEEAE